MNVAQARAVRYTDIAPAKKRVVGSETVSPQNEVLGQLEDFMLHAGVGPVSYRGVPLQLVRKARQA